MNIRRYLENLSPEEIEKNNLEHIEETDKIFEEFQDAYSKSCCSLCGNKIDKFISDEHCFHWFTIPNGIRKKDFKEYLSNPIGYFKLESYFRWMATIEKPLANINDLPEENSSKLKEITIRWKNLEWSLNYGETDLNGHQNSKNADFPHFHIQVLLDGRPFIRFNDFHVPFSKEDLFTFKMMKEAGDLVNFNEGIGRGMSAIKDPKYLEELDKAMKIAYDESKATFDTSSMISLPDGKKMPGKILQEAFKESRETGTPIRHIIHKYLPDANIYTEINPGKGVPDIKGRNKR
ncbi:hypothetical protein [Zunongwangia sp. HRR-M8]|uniref:hypothetical protein n=1 Tax=Zunongwangia sp. HRR-M8 TaxID=3015170 RepID=UPI0022DE42C5|nr:hypothetical protein [Zunongwangia sp. HRR-M8]WBL23836.1 hypothetical protein PBT89_07700 [Zunongwangia sp. HRR-M8]